MREAALKAHVPEAYFDADTAASFPRARQLRHPRCDRRGGLSAAGRRGAGRRRDRDLPVDRPVAVQADHRQSRSRRPGRRRTSASRSKSRSAPTSPSSRAINDAVAAAFPEERTFRIDHYLGKETVQNLLALRFANLLFEPVWSSAHIDHVQITVAETVGLEGRADYYDGAGALRDMVQNHMLQLLALVAMEPPRDLRRDRGARRKGQGAALAPPDAGRGQRHRPVRRRRGRGQAGSGLCRGTGPAERDRDLRRAQGPCRQLALGRRALLPPHRQTPAAAADRDRDPVPRVAALDVRVGRGQGGAQPADHRHPARREHHARTDGQAARASTAAASACAKSSSTSKRPMPLPTCAGGSPTSGCCLT